MRMVVEVTEELHAKVKERAKTDGRPMSHIVRKLLEQYASGVDTRIAAPKLMAVSVDKKPGAYPGSGIKSISKSDQAKGRTRK